MVYHLPELKGQRTKFSGLSCVYTLGWITRQAEWAPPKGYTADFKHTATNMVHRNILTAFLILLSPMLPAEEGKEGVVPNCSQASEPELMLRGQLAMVRQLAQGLTTLRYDLKIPERHSQVTLTINNKILGQHQKVWKRCYLSHRPCEHSTNTLNL